MSARSLMVVALVSLGSVPAAAAGEPCFDYGGVSLGVGEIELPALSGDREDALEVIGNFAFVAQIVRTSDWGYPLQVFDVSNLREPRGVASLELVASPYRPSKPDLVRAGDTVLYHAANVYRTGVPPQQGLWISRIDVAEPTAPTVTAQIEEQGRKLRSFAANERGVFLFDEQDLSVYEDGPVDLQLVHRGEWNPGFDNVAAAADGDVLYVLDSDGVLTVVDVSDLRSPETASSISVDLGPWGSPRIDVSGELVVVWMGASWAVLDASDVTNLEVVGGPWTLPRGSGWEDYHHILDLRVSGRSAVLSRDQNGAGYVSALDLADPAAPEFVQTLFHRGAASVDLAPSGLVMLRPGLTGRLSTVDLRGSPGPHVDWGMDGWVAKGDVESDNVIGGASGRGLLLYDFGGGGAVLRDSLPSITGSHPARRGDTVLAVAGSYLDWDIVLAEIAGDDLREVWSVPAEDLADPDRPTYPFIQRLDLVDSHALVAFHPRPGTYQDTVWVAIDRMDPTKISDGLDLPDGWRPADGNHVIWGGEGQVFCGEITMEGVVQRGSCLVPGGGPVQVKSVGEGMAVVLAAGAVHLVDVSDPQVPRWQGSHAALAFTIWAVHRDGIVYAGSKEVLQVIDFRARTPRRIASTAVWTYRHATLTSQGVLANPWWFPYQCTRTRWSGVAPEDDQGSRSAPRLRSSISAAGDVVTFRLANALEGPSDFEVFDVAGRRVAHTSYRLGIPEALRWRPQSGTGHALSPGVYFVRVKNARESVSGKFTILR